VAGDDLLIQIGADISDAQAAIGKLNDRVDDLGGSMHRAESKSGGFFSKISGGIGGIGLAATGIGALAVGIGGAALKGLDFNNSMEQVTAKLNAFTKDGKKSADILDMIRDRAAKTPFAFEEMAQAVSGLLPAAKMSGDSLESLTEKAEILAASNPAEGLEGAAFALREAVSGDFTSIIERFNLPRTYINQLKDEGVPALEIVSRAMGEMGYDTELVSNMANTASGRWSTFLDTMTGVISTITAPIFDALSKGLASINTLLEENQPAIQAFAEVMGGAVVGALQVVGTVIGAVVNGVSLLVGWFQSLITPTEQVGTSMSGVGQTITDVWNFLQPFLMGAVQAIGTALSKFWTEYGPQLQAVWASIQAAITAAINFIRPWIESWLSALQANWGTIWNGISTVVSGVWQVIQGVIKVATALIKGIIDTFTAVLKGDWEGAWTAIKNTVSGVWAGIQQIVSGAFTVLQGLFTFALGAIKTTWETVWNSIKGWVEQTWTAITTAVTNAWNGVISFLQALPGQIWSTVVNIGTSIISGIVQGLKNAGSQVIDFLKGLAGDAINAVKEFFGIQSPSTEMEGIGENLIAGLVGGLEGDENRVITAWTGILTKVTDQVTRAFDKNEPTSIVGLWNGGLDTMFDHLSEAWAPQVDVQLKFWFTRWLGLFQDFVDEVQNIWANLPDVTGDPNSPPAGSPPGSNGPPGRGILPDFARRSPGAPARGNQPVAVHVYLDSREVSRSLATRQRIRVGR
jgi:phage-related protein